MHFCTEKSIEARPFKAKHGLLWQTIFWLSLVGCSVQKLEQKLVELMI
jgi:hypothetical protein